MTVERAYVYILANGFKRLYTGVTAKLPERMREHKMRVHPECFTARYNIDQLVWYEEHVSIVGAIAREKQIKGWLRVKKVQLIVGSNPDWTDLSRGLLRMLVFDESRVRAAARFGGG